MINWGELRIDGVLVHVFCAVLGWSRFRFVRFAVDQKSTTTFEMLAECFTADPRKRLADHHSSANNAYYCWAKALPGDAGPP
ncbi:MAG: hypothetical protein L0H93_16465 [Nocardioides sp.]|nr:hypothetical protein [Nocardioides sp.]